VAKLVYGKTSVLLMADVDTAVENNLLALDGKNLESTILKVGHHGSKYSSAPKFVADVAPQFAVISDGKNNVYGFPAPETLATFTAQNIPVLRTDQLGTIIFESNGTTFWQVK